ncbi:MAG TPA: Crp/Fnr family transcriptional regulator [Sulfurimonas sp.]|nr:Crp/Fnr family transcriptional regulator [Sulfurimonas sp.]
MTNENDTPKEANQLILKEVQNLPTLQNKQKYKHFSVGSDPLNSVDTSKYFYFIMSGKVKIYEIDFNSSKEQVLYLLSRGDMFDVVSLLDKQLQNEYLSEVLEDVELIEVPLADVQKMILEDETFRSYFYTYLAQKLRSVEELAVSLSFYDVLQRIVQLFTRYTHQDRDKKADLRVIDTLKHDDIASMVGSVRKVVNRSLQTLKKDGIIELSRKKIQIKDFQKLLDKLSV